MDQMKISDEKSIKQQNLNKKFSEDDVYNVR